MQKRLACAALPALILVALLAPVSGPGSDGARATAATAPTRPVAPWAAELGPRPFAEVGTDAPEATGSWAAPARFGEGLAPSAPARRVTGNLSVPVRHSGRFVTPPSRAPPVLS